ncbi:MAG: hypothetical protein EOP06_27215 [Proteobacteria bacterium]|nr:MAG: hypothetical protein EOP06_27215 [Pseudomonadota bacterium]
MPPFFTLGKSGLLWSVPLALIGLLLIYLVVHKLVQTMRKAELAKVPLQESSTVTFEEAGNVQMHIEGPRFSRTFNGLQYELIKGKLGDGQRVPISRLVVATRSSGFSTVRELYGEVFIREPGRYELHVSRIGNQQDIAQCRIVFTRPYTLIMVLCILGILFSGITFIGGVVMSGINWGIAKN